MFHEAVKTRISDELARGAAARREGFEGRARVCARRAAGIAVREYLLQKGISAPGPSAYDALAYVRDFPEFDSDMRNMIEHLLMRVDQEFTLPEKVDVLAEAGWLVQALENLAGKEYNRGHDRA